MKTMLKLVFNIQKRLVLLAFFYALQGCDSAPEQKALFVAGSTMGTTYSVKVVDQELGLSESDLRQQLETLLKAFNQSMSTYIPDSELSKFNRSPVNEWFSISEDFCRVIELSEKVSIKSAGGFDVTVGPLVNLWGFGPEDNQGAPSREAIDAAMQSIGFASIQSDCAQVRIKKDKSLYVDLSAVAKGFATDVLARKLEQLGFHDYMVEIGGELYLSGLNAEKEFWRIAIEKPSVAHEGAVQILSLMDVGIATSGDYRNYYEVDGQRVSHTIDPTTGAPIDHGLASVTVVARSGGEADAWATALNVLGPIRGFDLAQAERLAAYFIVREGDEYVVKYTTEFKQYLVAP